MLKKIFKKSNIPILIESIGVIGSSILAYKLEAKNLYIVAFVLLIHVLYQLSKIFCTEESPTKEQMDKVIDSNSEIKDLLSKTVQERRNELLQKIYNIDSEQEIKAAIESDSASDKAKALDLLNKNIQSNESTMATNYFYAAKLLSFGIEQSKENLESALFNINKAYMLDPYNWEYIKEALFLLNKNNNAEETLKFYDSLLNNFEKVESYKGFDKWYLYLIGEICYVFKKFYKAQEIFKFLYETVEISHPAEIINKLQFMQALAQVYLVNASFSEAICLYDEALSCLDDVNADIVGRFTHYERTLDFWYLKGRCLLIMRDVESAKEYFEKILDEIYIDFYVNDFIRFIVLQAKACIGLIIIRADKVLLNLHKAQQKKINIDVENIFENELKQIAYDLSLNRKNKESQYCLSLIKR